jgi:hypothetical protein
MAMEDTGKAIRNVTELLRYSLKKLLKEEHGLEINVEAGRPEPPNQNGYKKRLNLFLYEARFDPSLKNVSLQDEHPEPLWLILHYLLTAYDDNGDSDSLEAYEYLGEGIRALQALNYIRLTASTQDALEDNPEPLKITFNEASVELLSKLMQGGDEKYRFSMAFEVRPIMIATAVAPPGTLLVGVDYSGATAAVKDNKDRCPRLQVLPSIGPKISSISPLTADIDDTIAITGTQLGADGLTVVFGPLELGATSQKKEALTFKIEKEAVTKSGMSAGSHPLKIRQALTEGRYRTSNLMVAHLRPEFTSVTIDWLETAVHPDDPGELVIRAKIILNGLLMGNEKDDIQVILYRDGEVVKRLYGKGEPEQKQARLRIGKQHGITPGTYRLILSVNGQQALNSPEIKLQVT